jgi:aspartyl-tRNA(Asn)/glutamyl-tRNA(Gln) amidotransferase subunit B
MGSSEIVSVRLIVGMEVHVELGTRSKMFSRAPNPAHRDFDNAAPNTLIDPTVLALPGALPVMNKKAVELSIMVGLALNCDIPAVSKWDRKGYFYPDLPKAYQISQYDQPLCVNGAIDVPQIDERGSVLTDAPMHRVRIIRAHLEEDAGKLLHELPGGGAGAAIDYSIVDLNRAGTPLLEIVTAPDFESAEQAVSFARLLRSICRFLGASECVMQKGHIRFEPNINTVLTLADGREATTPIVEVKNLNSFRSLRGAIEYEMAEQPRRWQRTGVEHAPGAKSTYGWDDVRNATFLQREKEEAHDYRYFPDPDLVPVVVNEEWMQAIRASIPELPLTRQRRYMNDYALTAKEAAAIVDEREVCFYYEEVVGILGDRGVDAARAGRISANFILQYGAKRANERGVLVSELGITPAQVAGIAVLREEGKIGSSAADQLFGLLCEPSRAGADPAAMAREHGMLIVRDSSALEAWVVQTIAANERAAADVRAGKAASVGRLVGEVMKLSGGQADPRAARELLLKKLEAST